MSRPYPSESSPAIGPVWTSDTCTWQPVAVEMTVWSAREVVPGLLEVQANDRPATKSSTVQRAAGSRG